MNKEAIFVVLDVGRDMYAPIRHKKQNLAFKQQ